MNWEAIGAIGQMLGSITVLVTLIYLAGQLRESRRETRRLINQRRSDALIEFFMTEATDERLPALLAKARAGLGPPTRFVTALMDRAGLSLEDALRLSYRESAWCTYRAQVIVNVDELTPGQRAEFDSGIRGYYLTFPLSALWYQHARVTGVDPDAVRYIDAVLARSG